MPATVRSFGPQAGEIVTPSAASAERLIKKLDDLQKRLDKERKLPADFSAQLKLLEEQLAEVKSELKFNDDALDTIDWAAKSNNERQRIAATLDHLHTQLTDLNQDQVRLGKQCFGAFLLVFTLLCGVYLYLHAVRRPAGVDGQSITKAFSQLRTIEMQIQVLTKAKATASVERSAQEKLASAQAAVKSAVTDFSDTAKGLSFSVATLQLLGETQAEAATGQLTDTETFANFSKSVSAELESYRSFLWSDSRWRWVEIAFWAELGTLVGILFYVAGSLGEGQFAGADISMFLAEVFIAPVVILAIFFLFNLTGITGISPSQTSITEIAGLAFIFGFAIRRTLGLLDTVKKRLFPDPAPAGASAEK